MTALEQAEQLIRRPAVAVSLIIAVACIAYLPSLQGGFVWDDEWLITNNDLIKDAGGLFRIWFTKDPIDYWPVSNTCLWIEWRLWGINPLGYHVVSVALHAAAAVLIWTILRRLRIPGALLAALLFAVHPVNVETVAWIAQRKTLLATVFFLLSILCYLKDEEDGSQRTDEFVAGHWYWLSLVAFLLGMLSKGSVATLPLVLLLIIWWQFGRITAWDLRRTAPFFVVAAVLAVVDVWFQTHGIEAVRQASLAERLAGAGTIPWFYLWKALVPLHLTFVYPQWTIDISQLAWWMPLVAAMAVTALLWRWRSTRWGRAIFFAWGFFWAMLVPVLGFADVTFMRWSLVADHYQYVAIIGVVALLAAAWSVWKRHSPQIGRRAASGLAVAVLGALMLLTWRQSLMYASEETLWRETMERNPTFWIAYNNLGRILTDSNRAQDALPYFERAAQIKPDEAMVYYNWGSALLELGRVPEAIEQCQYAVRMKPEDARARCNLGEALRIARRLDEASLEFAEALRLKPNYPEAHNNLGNLLLDTGQRAAAIEHYREALRWRADYPEAHMNLAVALSRENLLTEALVHFGEALRLKPDFVEAHYNLGSTLLAYGRSGEARTHFEQAVRLKSDLAEASFGLAMADAQVGRGAEAVAAAEQALAIARAQGNAALAQQIESWLSSNRGGPSNGADKSSSPPTPP